MDSLFEFNEGDIISKIGHFKKYLITCVPESTNWISAEDIETNVVVTGDKLELMRDYVKVGVWDKNLDCEVEDD